MEWLALISQCLRARERAVYRRESDWLWQRSTPTCQNETIITSMPLFCSGHSLFCWPWMVLDLLGGGIQQNNGHSTSLLLSKATKSNF